MTINTMCRILKIFSFTLLFFSFSAAQTIIYVAPPKNSPYPVPPSVMQDIRNGCRGAIANKSGCTFHVTRTLTPEGPIAEIDSILINNETEFGSGRILSERIRRSFECTNITHIFIGKVITYQEFHKINKVQFNFSLLDINTNGCIPNLENITIAIPDTFWKSDSLLNKNRFFNEIATEISNKFDCCLLSAL